MSSSDIKSSKKKTLKERASYYLENKKLKHLLLKGIPESNTFEINSKNSEIFINSQQTKRKKKAAEILIKTAIYIKHSEFIQTMRILIEKMFTILRKKKIKNYVIFSENEKKSGFFCTMIFLFIVQEEIEKKNDYWMPIDIVIGMNFKKHDSSKINYIMINDMDYTSNQLSTRLYGKLRRSWDINVSNNNFFILRAYSNSHAVSKLFQYSSKINYIYGKLLPTLKEQIDGIFKYEKICDKENTKPGKILGNKTRDKKRCLKHKKCTIKKNKNFENICSVKFKKYWKNTKIQGDSHQIYTDIISFFGGCYDSEVPAPMNVYLDHKIADYSSSNALMLTLGIVPNNSSYYTNYKLLHPCSWGVQKKTSDPGLDYKENTDNLEDINNPKQLVVPLIDNCDYTQISEKYFNDNEINGKVQKMKNKVDEKQILRCPYAWYKIIDYERGIVNTSSTRIKHNANKNIITDIVTSMSEKSSLSSSSKLSSSVESISNESKNMCNWIKKSGKRVWSCFTGKGGKKTVKINRKRKRNKNRTKKSK